MVHSYTLAAALCCLLVRGQFNSQSPFDRVLTPGLAGIGGLRAEAMDSGTVTRIRAQIQDGSKGRCVVQGSGSAGVRMCLVCVYVPGPILSSILLSRQALAPCPTANELTKPRTPALTQLSTSPKER